MKYRNSYQFMLYWFQNILDLLGPEWDPERWTEETLAQERAGIAEEYRKAFRMDVQVYPDEHVWKTIERKFEKEFDNLLFEVIEKRL